MDFSEHGPSMQGESPRGWTRRDVIRRGLAAQALIWTPPAVISLRTATAFAATPPPPVQPPGNGVQPPPGNGEQPPPTQPPPGNGPEGEELPREVVRRPLPEAPQPPGAVPPPPGPVAQPGPAVQPVVRRAETQVLAATGLPAGVLAAGAGAAIAGGAAAIRAARRGDAVDGASDSGDDAES